MKNKIEFEQKLKMLTNEENSEINLPESIFEQKEELSLPIKILSIFGGVIGSMLFVIFLFFAGIYNNESAQIILGIVLLIISVLVNKLVNSIVTDTFSIAGYGIGIFLLAFGLGESHVDESLICFLGIIIGLATMAITRTYLFTFLSVIMINFSIFCLIMTFDNAHQIQHYNSKNLVYTDYLIHLIVSLNILLLTTLVLNEVKLIVNNKSISELFEPIRNGVLVSLVLFSQYLGHKHFLNEVNTSWYCSIASGLCILYLVRFILKKLNITETPIIIVSYTLIGLILIGIGSSAPLSISLLITLLCFLSNYKTGFGIGVISLIYFLGQFYYDLHMTLLHKSVLLFATGSMFLILYFLISKKPTNENI